MKNESMKIEWVDTKEIHPYKHNPRDNDSAVDAVAKSIHEFGWRQPIVVDASNTIICGHTRLKAAQKLKIKKVPVHVVTDLTAEQVRAYRLADNRTSDFADWDIDLLAEELKGLDLSALGLDDLDFGELIANIPVSPESFPEQDENIDTEHTCPKCGYRWSGGK